MEIPDLQNSKWIDSYGLWVYYGIIFLVGGLLLFFWRATPFDIKNLASIFPWGKIQSQEGSQSQWDSVKNYSPSEKESFLWSWMYRVTNSIKGYTLASIWDFPLLYPRAIAIDAYDNIYIGESYQWSGTHARILKFSCAFYYVVLTVMHLKKIFTAAIPTHSIISVKNLFSFGFPLWQW